MPSLLLLLLLLHLLKSGGDLEQLLEDLGRAGQLLLYLRGGLLGTIRAAQPYIGPVLAVLGVMVITI